MPDLPITQLPAAGAVTNTDLLAIVQSGETRKIAAINFKGDVGATGAAGAAGAAGPAGSNTFIALTDTDPTTYVAQAAKYVKVNAGETGLDLGTLTVPIDNVVFVAENGSASGARGDLLRPFATLKQAADIAQSGDLIYVFAGAYTETNSNLLADNVFWYFERGAVITVNLGAGTGMFASSSAITSAVLGYGVFNAIGAGSVMRINNASIVFYFEFESIDGSVTTPCTITGTGCTRVELTGRELTRSGGTNYAGLIQGPGDVIVDIDRVNSGSLIGFFILAKTSGSVKIRVKDSGTTSGGVAPGGFISVFNTTTGTTIDIEDCNATCTNSAGAVLNLEDGGTNTINIKNCKFDSEGPAVRLNSGGSSAVTFSNCILSSDNVQAITRLATVTTDARFDNCYIYTDGTSGIGGWVGGEEGVVTDRGTGPLKFDHCIIKNNLSNDLAHVINYDGAEPQFMATRLLVADTATLALSVFVTGAENIRILSLFGNADMTGGGLITNTVAGTTYIWDTSII